MKALVCGGRHYENRVAVFRALDALHAEMWVDLLIHGGAFGADRLAAQWAHVRELPALRHPARWTFDGKRAGPRRNEAMLRWKPDICLWFPGGAGTAHMKAVADKAGVTLIDGEALASGQV